MKKLWGSFAFMMLLYLALFLSGRGAMSLQNHLNMAGLIGQFGMICLGAGILIISGGIDLSDGAVLGLSGTVGAWVMEHLMHSGTAASLTIAAGYGAGIAVGILIGFLNGVLITKLRLAPFIVTLGTLGIAAGMTDVVSSGAEITDGGLDAAVRKLTRDLLNQRQIANERILGRFDMKGGPTFLIRP